MVVARLSNIWNDIRNTNVLGASSIFFSNFVLGQIQVYLWNHSFLIEIVFHRGAWLALFKIIFLC